MRYNLLTMPFDDTTMRLIPQPAPKRHPVLSAGLGAILVLAAGFWPLSQQPAAIFTSPTHLRQIMVTDSALDTTTQLYLCDAGFHSRHARHWLATIYGAQNLAVAWRGPDAAVVHMAAVRKIASNPVTGVIVNYNVGN